MELRSPNFACDIAFRALEMIEKGLLQESNLKGLKRDQMKTTVEGQWKIHQAEMRLAEQNRQAAEEAKKRAEMPHQLNASRLETQARVHTEQAEHHQTAAKEKAKEFGKEAGTLFRKAKVSVASARKPRNAPLSSNAPPACTTSMSWQTGSPAS